MNKKGKIILGLILGVALIGGGAFYFMNNSEAPKKEETTSSVVDSSQVMEDKDSSKPEPEPEKVVDEFTKEGAVKATTEMLKELQKAPDDKLTLANRMDKVSAKDYNKSEIFTEAGWNYIHLSDFMQTDPRGATLAAQALLSVIHSIEETGNKDMKPAEVDLSGVVYFDEKLKTAYVPIDLYTNAPTNLSFEMVYINDVWILQPYTLIAQIAIRTMEQSVISQTPEGKKNPEVPASDNTDSSSSEKKTDEQVKADEKAKSEEKAKAEEKAKNDKAKNEPAKEAATESSK